LRLPKRRDYLIIHPLAPCEFALNKLVTAIIGPSSIGLDPNAFLCGKHNETSVFAAFDMAPSLPSITGVKPPSDVNFDGQDMSDTIIGKASTSRTAPLFWRRPPDRKNAAPAIPDPQPDLAIREGNWKLLCEYDGTSPELYDLAVDRAEETTSLTKILAS